MLSHSFSSSSASSQTVLKRNAPLSYPPQSERGGLGSQAPAAEGRLVCGERPQTCVWRDDEDAGQELCTLRPLRPSFFLLFQSLELFITFTKLLGGSRAHKTSVSETVVL